jgi:hypothetical protein
MLTFDKSKKLGDDFETGVNQSHLCLLRQMLELQLFLSFKSVLFAEHHPSQRFVNPLGPLVKGLLS